ncbi:MAG TPA: transglutaminase-like domain-containing protein [Candidatus Dojkabacteria bacterium]|nr:transglutaminase-like domain-containing protein [Candidatus Dojkabacteria bacterium]
MKNLNGYLKKIPWIFSFVLFLFLFPNSSYAVEFFTTTSSFKHTLTQESVNTELVLDISSKETRVISFFTASIPIKNLDVKCYNYKTNKKIDCTTYDRSSSTEILFNLNNTVVRPTAPLQVKITYSTPSSDSNSYQISSYVSDTKTVKVLVIYPKEKGQPIWSSDPITDIKSVGSNYQIQINNPLYSTLSLLFGNNIIYQFEVHRVFTNSLTDQNQTFELILPPDTQNQSIIWEKIEPLPNTSQLDINGNYIFKYIVTSDSTIDATVKGYVYKRDATVSDSLPATFYTARIGYWNLTNSNEYKRINTFITKKGLSIPEDVTSVSTLENSQRELLYKYLYQYTIEKLDYNRDLQLGITEQTRVGVNALVDNPSDSSPIDYADFLIALYRGYDIPARMVVGYVSNISGFTSDGFFHYWVEYYDSSLKSWITLDPFLEDYSTKSLYKSNFADHITILRRGKSPLAPNLTFYEANDFLVTSVPNAQIVPQFKVDAGLTFEKNTVTRPFTKGYISLSNTGNIAITGYEIKKSNIENITRYIDPINNMSSQIVLPKQNSNIQINLPMQEKDINFFVNIRFTNQNIFSSEEILEYEMTPTVPILLDIFVKILSTILFILLSSLIYFGIVKLKKHG